MKGEKPSAFNLTTSNKGNKESNLSGKNHVQNGSALSYHDLSGPQRAVADKSAPSHRSNFLHRNFGYWGRANALKLNSWKWIFQILLNGIFSSARVSNPLVLSTDARLGVRSHHPPSPPWDLTSSLRTCISSFNSVSASSTELKRGQKNPITVVREGE